MIIHPQTRVLFVVDSDAPSLQSLLSYLGTMQHIELARENQIPQNVDHYDVVVTASPAIFAAYTDRLTEFVQAGGGWLGLVQLSEEFLPPLFGVQPSPVGPEAELRVLFQQHDHPLATRLSNPLYLKGRYQALRETSEDVEVILYADWHFQHSAVLTSRPAGKGHVACTTLQAHNDPAFQQIIYRLLRWLGGQLNNKRTFNIGLLGYAQSVGQAHGLAIEATPGLALRAACDLNQERLNRAGMDFPGVDTYESVDELAKAPDLDLVIIATPPNSHARLSIDMMAAGKHVVCEKPLALNRRETTAMVEMAERQGVHLSCHQNRRWDVDYLAIKQALAEGLLGDLFYVETFVGGFIHPCGYWHSHDAISGGTTYDWGGHYLDWIVSLIPDPIVEVICTRHNRVWHDITNADQERIQMRFAGGQEAEFIHSDIAAVRKPKWYLLGTEGAIVGRWLDVATYEIDPILYFHRHDIPATEMVPDLTLHRRHHSGQIVAQQLALPKREHYLFHRNLADHLITGEPILTPLEESVQVVTILEAAAKSAAHGGKIEVLNG